jgi:hypothetical protein
MDAETHVVRRPEDVSREWLEQVLDRKVRVLERVANAGTWSTHVRLRAFVEGDAKPLPLRVKLGSAEIFGRNEVEYYTRYFEGLADAPLVHCHHAAADATHYHLLLDDLADTHRNQFDVVPTERYGRAFVEAVARLHAHRWPEQPPNATALDRALEPARAGLSAMLDAMANGFSARERDQVRELFEWHPGALRARLDDPQGFTWVHGDLNPGNILAPIEGDVPIFLIDHQPFARSSLLNWLGVGDIAHAMAVWWPVDARRAWERQLVAHWHALLVARGIEGYPLAKAWEDYRLCALQGIYVPAARCSEPVAVTGMRWVWELQLRRVLAAAADLS